MSDIRWTTRRVGRIGDMHPEKALWVHINRDGDLVISIGESELPLGNIFGDDNASVEFCSISGGSGRSPKTRTAILDLMEAIKQDNQDRPDANPVRE